MTTNLLEARRIAIRSIRLFSRLTNGISDRPHQTVTKKLGRTSSYLIL
tara:strand:- start:508 stop:651 length:144 start_codon:yes stop_codon:yes gene_type:complete